MMTTFAEKMLAKALQLEDQAKALRVAAEVMNGHALTAKHVAMASTVIAAAKLRKQQRPTAEGAPPALVEAGKRGDIEPLVLSFLDGNAPQRVGVIRQHLAEQGVHVSEYRVRHFVHTHPRIARQGKGSNTLWQLRGESEPPPPATPLSPYAATKQRRAAKTEQILTILREHGGSMQIRELATAAREQGIGSLTGISGLVRKGLLTSRGRKGLKRYRLVGS